MAQSQGAEKREVLPGATRAGSLRRTDRRMAHTGTATSRTRRVRFAATLCLALILPVSAGAGMTEADPPAVERAPHAVNCARIEAAAGGHDLPVAFLTRLIWRESRFRPQAVSHKGAQGIAQFMPTTAAERGLADPFDPAQAIPAAASLLADHRKQFGNLGLAAAAYNGGPQRVADWLSGSGGLPGETRRFVRLVTGRLPEDWKADDAATRRVADPLDSARPVSCLSVLATLGRPEPILPLPGPVATAPWGALVGGHFSRERALAIYASLQRRHDGLLAGRGPMLVGTRNRSRGPATFFDIRVPAETREEAQAICAKLRAAGAGCLVRKS